MMRVLRQRFVVPRQQPRLGDPRLQDYHPASRIKSHTITINDGRFDHELGQTSNAILGVDVGELIVSNSIDVELDSCRVLSDRGVAGQLIVRRPNTPYGVKVIPDIAKAASGTGNRNERRRLESVLHRSGSGRRITARPRNRS